MSSIQLNKMLAGELYDASDATLVEARLRARRLLAEYNASAPDDLTGRTQILQELLGRAEQGIYIEPPFRCDYGSYMFVGQRFYANFNLVVLDCAPVVIGDDVLIGPNVGIYTATHPVCPELRKKGLEYAQEIRIDNGVWIGGGSTICPGVHIGENSVIGAGSVVTKDIPPNVVAVGNPCRVLRTISEADRERFPQMG